LLRRKNEPGCWLCTGTIAKSKELADIPVRAGAPGKETLDSVSVIPFAQARERGWPVHDGGEPIVTLVVDEASYHDLDEVLAVLPTLPVAIRDVVFDSTSEEYERTIRRIVDDEIGTGQGANFVISRRCSAQLLDFSPRCVLSIFRSFLLNEFGTYWSFVFGDGQSFVLGATPERHISARQGDVMMNPISGTFRKAEHASMPEACDAFIEFLRDEKEIFELFMVTDEELKIMCDICDQGGAIVGPLLKEMSKLIHTEYLLLGRSDNHPIDLLRQSMFAPTVTGSPLSSAFRVIERYEHESRGYYGATVALLGRDAAGVPTLDAPIAIRTLEVDRQGGAIIRVGATLVRGSDPSSEVKETEAKIAGVLAAIRATHEAHPTLPSRLLDAVDYETVQILLQRRNLYLSRFWFEPQSANYNAVPELGGKRVRIIDAEDAFSTMLRRQIEQMGAQVDIVGFDGYEFSTDVDVTIVGPGPGDPTSRSDPKMIRLREILQSLKESGSPFFAECLAHQILCDLLGFTVVNKQVPFQGAQSVIDLFGKAERVGFYNTFVALAGPEIEGVEVAADPKTAEIHALRGGGFFSVQFHPESILTPRGYELLRDALVRLL
jgi:phenazine biosynthesis protein phzE